MAWVRSFRGKGMLERVELVNDERVKPGPIELPMLRPTLQVWVGMVLGNGEPQNRAPYEQKLDEATSALVQQRERELRDRCDALRKDTDPSIHAEAADVKRNLHACASPVSTRDLLEYIRRNARLDIEQVVAMTIGYLSSRTELSDDKMKESDSYSFVEGAESIVTELINDPGTVYMLNNAHMWREAHDFKMPADQRAESKIHKQQTILQITGRSGETCAPNTPSFVDAMQHIRRKRAALKNTQRLALPEELLPDDETERDLWSFAFNSYRRGRDGQAVVHIENPQVLSKRQFNRVHRLLGRIHDSRDPGSVYVRDVETLIKETGMVSPERIEALQSSDDAAAIAFSFVAVMRRRQLKVVSDHGWSRFLVKGEGKRLLQNSPDVLTSFEDILVQYATDLKALTAVKCPEGVRDHFTTERETSGRARRICELMERYVELFGRGKMENLVFETGKRGGSGRGPVDLYNVLCDELQDCRRRATAAGKDLNIGPVHKFLAKDIMASNNAWKDDAFAGGKVPGWVEYLARVRAEEMTLD